MRITPQEISRRHRELRLISRGGEQRSLGSQSIEEVIDDKPYFSIVCHFYNLVLPWGKKPQTTKIYGLSEKNFPQGGLL